MGAILAPMLFQPPPVPSYTIDNDSNYCTIPTPEGYELAGRFLDYGHSTTIFFSHGNAEDIGTVSTYLHRHLCARLQVNAFVYDYAGYGRSAPGVQPTERQIYSNAASAYGYLTETLGVDPSSIILYGRSLGACATTDLASSISDPVLGVVLQCPMLSVFRIGFPFRFTAPFDIFPNIDKVGRITAPTFVLHGIEDGIIPFWHGSEIHKLLPNAVEPLWLACGHNNLESACTGHLFDALADFIDQVSRERTLSIPDPVEKAEEVVLDFITT